MTEEGSQRLQKILAQAGYGSRRSCEEIIRRGRVRVNGQVAALGDGADPARDDITVDGERVQVGKGRHTYVALYKPVGVISTLSDERGRKTVRDMVPLEQRLVPVGRLDADSEGLVLLTDDGELINVLTHPRYESSKEYHVLVAGHPDEEALTRWRQGVNLADLDAGTRDGGWTAPAQVKLMRKEKDETWLRVVMHEGRKRQIRRVANLLGHPVRKLIRVRIGPVRLGELSPGRWRHLAGRELTELVQLKEQAKGQTKGRTGPRKRPPKNHVKRQVKRHINRRGHG